MRTFSNLRIASQRRQVAPRTKELPSLYVRRFATFQCPRGIGKKGKKCFGCVENHFLLPNGRDCNFCGDTSTSPGGVSVNYSQCAKGEVATDDPPRCICPGFLGFGIQDGVCKPVLPVVSGKTSSCWWCHPKVL